MSYAYTIGQVCTERRIKLLVGLLMLPLLALSMNQAQAQSVELLQITTNEAGAQNMSVSLQVLLFMTALSVLPALLMTMTAFTRIIIVLSILRQGLGTQQTPSNQVMVGLALFLTLFVMAPVVEQVNVNAVQPYIAEEIGPQDALLAAKAPVRGFMLTQTRETDLALFTGMAGHEGFDTPADVPMSVLVPAFLTSELKTAFQIGFLLLIPFLIIDLVVASVLMSMGMVMLSPLIISLPFKIMLFVLVDGWSLVMTTVAGSFFVL